MRFDEPGRLSVGLALDDRRDGLKPTDAYRDEAAVARLVRRALREAGLGRKDDDAPLRDVVPEGATVLVKPNWVLDRNQSGEGMECMVTHPAVVGAVLAEIARARPGRVIVGDAPIQLCRFDRLVTPDVRARFERAAGVPVEIVDFRRTVAASQDLSEGVTRERNPEGRYVAFDLATQSLLEAVSSPDHRFRVTNYDPGEMARHHRGGRHE